MCKQYTLVSMSSDKLFFYSKSADKPAPGKGTNECVTNPREYDELAKIVGWRKVLSNFHTSPFTFEGATYNSIEHVFQAKKIALIDPVRALEFTVESGTVLGTGDGALAQKHRKMILLNSDALQRWDQIKDDVMKRAAVAKYNACPGARNILRLTGSAELWHSVSRGKPMRFAHLEELRIE